jgi:hypothetical protein
MLFEMPRSRSFPLFRRAYLCIGTVHLLESSLRKVYVQSHVIHLDIPPGPSRVESRRCWKSAFDVNARSGRSSAC